MDADPEQGRTELAIGDVEDVRAAHRPAVDATHHRSRLDGGTVETEARQAGKTVGCSIRPAPRRPRLVEPLEQLNVVAIAGQECRRREARLSPPLQWLCEVPACNSRPDVIPKSHFAPRLSELEVRIAGCVSLLGQMPKGICGSNALPRTRPMA